jgi:hypothetical protein
MKTSEINRLVDKAYSALDVLNNITWTSYRDKLCDMACAEERDHRKPFGRFGHPPMPKGASVVAAGKLFAVKRIAERLTGKGHQPTIADVISYQPSAIYAASLVDNYRERIEAAWAGLDVAQLAELDYCEFVGNEDAIAAKARVAVTP